MTTHQLVRTEHLNQYGLLFGGQMLAWVDEAAAVACRLDWPREEFVTAAMDEVVFRRSVGSGSILAFEVERVHCGTTSVGYRVEVRVASDPAPGHREQAALTGEVVFGTTVTVVHIDDEGCKKPLPDGP